MADVCRHFTALRVGLRQRGRGFLIRYPAFRFAQSGINPRPILSRCKRALGTYFASPFGLGLG
jgi:hypothetical protein